MCVPINARNDSKSINGSFCSNFHTRHTWRKEIGHILSIRDMFALHCDLILLNNTGDFNIVALHRAPFTCIWRPLRVNFRPLLCRFVIFFKCFASVLILLYFNVCCCHRAEVIIFYCAIWILVPMEIWMFLLLKYCMWQYRTYQNIWMYKAPSEDINTLAHRALLCGVHSNTSKLFIINWN